MLNPHPPVTFNEEALTVRPGAPPEQPLTVVSVQAHSGLRQANKHCADSAAEAAPKIR
jgi:hypothetical protein